MGRPLLDHSSQLSKDRSINFLILQVEAKNGTTVHISNHLATLHKLLAPEHARVLTLHTRKM